MIYLPYSLYPLPHDMDIYSYHEGEEKERGASALLRHPRYGFKYFKGERLISKSLQPSLDSRVK